MLRVCVLLSGQWLTATRSRRPQLVLGAKSARTRRRRRRPPSTLCFSWRPRRRVFIFIARPAPIAKLGGPNESAKRIMANNGQLAVASQPP